MNKPKFKHFNGVIWAVFNCHEQDEAKGRQAVIAKFGKEGWKKVLERKRSGIMEIFEHDPTPETKLYAQTVALAADARYDKKRMKS